MKKILIYLYIDKKIRYLYLSKTKKKSPLSNINFRYLDDSTLPITVY